MADIIKPNILTPTIITPQLPGGEGSGDTDPNSPTTGGKNQPALPNLQDAGTDQESAKHRDELRQLLGILGYNLPVTVTDLQNTSNKMVALQDQLTQQIKELQDSGGDPAGFGEIAGPPDPAVKAKIDALNDLQNQLKDTATKFKEYAYQYFTDAEKPLTLSQGKILQAYNEGVIKKQDAVDRLAAAGVNATDIGVLLGIEDKDMLERAKKDAETAKKEREAAMKPGLSASNIAEGYKKGLVDKASAQEYLGRLGLSKGEIGLLLGLEDYDKAKEAADAQAKAQKDAQKSRPSSSGGGAPRGGSSGGGSRGDTKSLASAARDAARRRLGR